VFNRGKTARRAPCRRQWFHWGKSCLSKKIGLLINFGPPGAALKRKYRKLSDRINKISQMFFSREAIGHFEFRPEIQNTNPNNPENPVNPV